MKRLILMVSLLAPVHTFAKAKPCERANQSVRYLIWNQSKYSIGLKFDKAEEGDNPANIDIEPYKDTYPVTPVTAYGCSHEELKGYETKATLMMHGGESNENLAYFHIKRNLLGGSTFSSFENQGINHPLCSCTLRTGSLWTDMKAFDCSSYTGSLLRRTEIRIGCK